MKIVADQAIPALNHYFAAQDVELILRPARAINAQDVRDADALIVRSVTKVDQALLQGSAVKFVGSMTAGHDHLALDWLKAQGVSVALAKGFNAPPVVDYVMAVLAALENRQIRPFSSIKRAAVIGVGAIGAIVADKLQALGVEVVTCDPYRAEQQGFNHTEIDVICDVDLITLHVPYTKANEVVYPTEHLINHSFIERQKDRTLIINACRGGVIDSEALQLSIKLKDLIVALDVWEGEPWIDSQLLQALTIVTPHIAGYSVESKTRGLRIIFDAFCKYFKRHDQPPLNIHSPIEQSCVPPAGNPLSWDEIVLQIFNPFDLTNTIKSEWPQYLVSHEKKHLARLFDHMRASFNQRHEFSAIELTDCALRSIEARCLSILGFRGKGMP